MSTLKATNIKNESSASNNIVLDSGGGVVVSGILTATTFSGNVSGNITIGAGSTSAPSLAPSGDSNTGVFFPSADTIAFAEGGTEAARIDSSGRLLVGTATNRSDFFNGSSTLVAPLQIEQSSNNNLNRFISFTSNNSDTGGPTILLGKSRGTTAGAVTIVQNDDQIGAISFQAADGTDMTEGARIEGKVDGTPGNNDMPTSMRFYTTNDGASSSTERLRITSLGFVKASPRITDATHGAQRVSSPVHEFTCDNNDWVMQMTHTSGSAAESSGLYIKYRSTTPNNSGSQFHYCADSSAARFVVTSNGGIQNYSANNVNLCDEREKKNIVNLDSTWDCLKHWELKKFHYNEDLDTDDLRYGVIAQQIAEYCPEVISEWSKQKASEAVLDENGNEIEPAKEEIVRLAVKEQQMYWMAIKALQEAQERIETLEAQNAAILARLDALESA